LSVSLDAQGYCMKTGFNLRRGLFDVAEPPVTGDPSYRRRVIRPTLLRSSPTANGGQAFCRFSLEKISLALDS
jgi:hypothetical protein